jgi:ABC-type transport system substrate-binding protein
VLALVALVPFLGLSACGSSGKGGGSTGAQNVDTNGVLHLGYDFVSNGDWAFDPTLANAPGQIWNELVYGTLLRRTFDGTYLPELAKEAKVVDTTTLTVELFPDLKFSDGTPLTADNVKFAIDRNVALPTNGRMFRGAELSAVQSVTVNSPTALTVKMKTPTAGSFFDLFAHEETMPMPMAPATVANLNSKPVGAGPYTLQSYEKGLKLILVKSPTYRDATKIQIPTIEVVHVTPQSLVNAANARNLDYTILGSFDTAAQISPSGLKIDAFPSPDNMGFLWLTCQTQNAGGKALADIRVRQALNYATDKDAINQVMLQGKGSIMNQLWPDDSKYADSTLNGLYPYNMAKAKDLLAQAGYANGLTLTFTNTGGSAQTTAELLQQQWAKAGVTVQLVPSTNGTQDFYVDRKINMSGTAGGVTRFWTDKLTRNWAPGSVGNTCDPAPDHPEFSAKLTELRGLAHDDAKAVQLWKDLAGIIIKGAYGVFMTHAPAINAYDATRIGNLKYWPTQVGGFWPDVHQIFIIKK